MTARSERIGVDTGWLVHLAIAEHAGHEATTRQLESFRTRDVQFAMTPQVLCEFVHVVTDARRFQRPVAMNEALNFAETWWSADNIVRIFPTDDSVRMAWHWMQQFRLGRKRILDTHLAAIWHVHSVDRIVSPNPADFAVFGVFDILDDDSSQLTKA
jgi:predicted nucleic acid-binding protein